MEHLKNFTLILTGTLLLLFSCSAPQPGGNVTTPEAPLTHPKGQASVEDEDSDKNILQVAISSEAHSTLVAGVEAAGIEHVLVNAGPLTVFAPTNEAFAALPDGTLETLLQPENKADLAAILTLHAAPGSFNPEKLKKEAQKGRKLYMATGDYLDIGINGEEITVAGAKVIGSIQTSNGVINVVDKVILPD